MQPVRGLLVSRREREARVAGSAARSARGELALAPLAGVGAGPQPQHELVDAARARRASACAVAQRREHDREGRLGAEVGARGGDDEVLGRERLAHDSARDVRRRASARPPRRQVVVAGEVVLERDHGPPGAGAARRRPRAMASWSTLGPPAPADDPARHDDRAPAASTRRPASGRPAAPSRRGHRPRRDACRERGAQRALASRCCPRRARRAGRACAARRSSRRPTSTRQTDMLLIAAYMPTPSASSSADRESPAAGAGARLADAHRTHSRARRRRLIAHQRRSAISTWPPSGGPSRTTRPLESSITRSATRAISRLCVTTITARPVCACACSSSRIWMPVWKSSSPVGSSASSVGFPRRQRARDRHPLLLASRELVREVPSRSPEARRARASRPRSRPDPAGRPRRPRTPRSRAPSAPGTG